MAGGNSELKLLGMWASPFVTRAKLALHIKGLSYDYAEEDLGNKSELLLSSNPLNKTVPALIHNGKPICESSIIVQYIDEAFAGVGPSLLPADPYHRFWASFIEDKLFSFWIPVFQAKTDQERAEAVRQTIAAVEVLEGGFKECSGGKGDFFGGESVGYVDVLLGSHVSWVTVTNQLMGTNLIDAAKTPLLAAWMERFCDLDVAKALLQDVNSLAEYAKMVQARFPVTAANNNAAPAS